MIKKFPLFLLSVLSLTLFTACINSIPDSESLLLVEKGLVELDTGTGYHPITGENFIHELDKIRTGNDAEATLTLKDSVIVTLDVNTEVIVKSISDIIAIKQEKGNTWNKFISLVGANGYTVSTPSTTATVRGTEFGVSVGEDNDSIIVDEGTVAVETDGEKIDVHEQEKIVNRKHGKRPEQKMHKETIGEPEKKIMKTQREHMTTNMERLQKRMEERELVRIQKKYGAIQNPKEKEKILEEIQSGKMGEKERKDFEKISIIQKKVNEHREKTQHAPNEIMRENQGPNKVNGDTQSRESIPTLEQKIKKQTNEENDGGLDTKTKTPDRTTQELNPVHIEKIRTINGEQDKRILNSENKTDILTHQERTVGFHTRYPPQNRTGIKSTDPTIQPGKTPLRGIIEPTKISTETHMFDGIDSGTIHRKALDLEYQAELKKREKYKSKPTEGKQTGTTELTIERTQDKQSYNIRTSIRPDYSKLISDIKPKNSISDPIRRATPVTTSLKIVR